MAFTVRGLQGMPDATASQLVAKSLAYLKASPLARQIIEELEENADVCIDVDEACEKMYFAHPESSYLTITGGGTVLWNPTVTLKTMESKNLRPDQPWVPQHTERAKVAILKQGLLKKVANTFNLSPTRNVRRNVPARKFGALSSHMCLMHELGHALQYATSPAEFLQVKSDAAGLDGYNGKLHEQTALEETNLACVEIPIALELNARGCDETPRWTYEHTGGPEKWT